MDFLQTDAVESADLRRALTDLCQATGLDVSAVSGVSASGNDPVLRTPYRVGAAGAASHLAIGLAAAKLMELRQAPPQTISVDVPAAVASLRANAYLTIDGSKPARPWDEQTGFYRVKDGRSVFLHCNFPNMRDNNAAVLGVPAERKAMEAACLEWDGEALETAIHAGAGCAAFVRTRAEWEAHPHRAFVAKMPLVEITRIGDAPAEPLKNADRPLAGIRALDLTRVLAGPACGRNLAEHGAEVMKVSRPDLPQSGLIDIDSGVGKFATFIDFRDPKQDAQLKALVRSGDVFLQSYRPGALASHGYAPEDLAALRPGIVFATLSAWGDSGPWCKRRGYDTIVQCASGMADLSGKPGEPAVLPVSALDYTAGNLLTVGILTALARRATEGGSWSVRVSLVATQHWLVGLGLIDAPAFEKLPKDVSPEVTAPYLRTLASSEGMLRYLGPVLKMSGTPPGSDRAPVPLGTHAPQWPSA